MFVKHHKYFGEIALVGTAVLEGFSPVLANMAAGYFPPILFVTMSVLTALVGLAVYIVSTGRAKYFDVRALPYATGVGILVLSGFVMIMIGTKVTSGINTALLLQNELVLMFLISVFILKEHTTGMQILGTGMVLIGTVVILYNGSFAINTGDILILLATFLFPFANILAKRGLSYAPPIVFLFMRYCVGFLCLLSMSFIFEDPVHTLAIISEKQIMFIVLYGVLVLTISKICWYTGLKILPVGQSTYIAASSPIFSLLFAYALLKEVPTLYQWVGFICTIVGMYCIIIKPKSSRQVVDLV